MRVSIENIKDYLIDGELGQAFSLASLVDWGDNEPLYKRLWIKYLDRPHGLNDTDVKDMFLAFISNALPESYDKGKEISYYKIADYLLKKDFHPQKEHLINSSLKSNIILLQGTPGCGLKYFIMGKHDNCSIHYIKGDQVSRTENDSDFWMQIADWFNLSESLKANIRQPKLDPPSLIHFELFNRSKEKAIVLIIYEVELWGENCLSTLIWLANMLSRIPIFEGKNGVYCYLIHTNMHEQESCYCDSENLISLPLVSELEEIEMKDLYLNYESCFTIPTEQVKSLFSERKKLSEIINIFIKHSNYGTQLDKHLNSQLPF